MRSTGALGSVSAFVAATGYGSAYVVARVAYDYGLNAFTLNFLRFMVLVAALALWMGISRGEFRTPPRSLGIIVLLGVLITCSGLSNYGAIAFIPVSLAILIFYTYPLVTLILSSIVDRRAPSATDYLAFLFTFAGLALALDVSLEGLDPRGIALALFASLTVGTHLVASQHALRIASMKIVTLYMGLTALVLTGLVTLTFGQFSVPDPGPGLWFLAYVITGFCIAMGATMAAVRMIGPVRTSIIMCMEPPVVIGCAFLLLGERLTETQLLGALLVVAGVVTAQWAGARRRAG
jgi:drug/metabolite transporter (DMT)-like permease